MMTTLFPPWAMLSRDYKESLVKFPVIVQPKLNGVRAMWNKSEKCFVSRSGKLIPEVCIPHLYSKMTLFPGVDYDGELYCHGMALQDIKGILTQSRKETAENAGKLDYNVFDIIETDYAVKRITSDAYRSYQPHLEHKLVTNNEELQYCLRMQLTAGFEGIVIRSSHGVYVEGRTDNLLKLKPLHRTTVEILYAIEGFGKFSGRLGAFFVWWEGKTFKCGGGNITVEQRTEMWINRKSYEGRKLLIEYRELTTGGIPAQAQIKEIL